MTISKYLNKNEDELEFYTVNELYADLEKLIEEGFGDRIVMVENYVDSPYTGDYHFIEKCIDTSDSEHKCIYFNGFLSNEDNYLASRIF